MWSLGSLALLLLLVSSLLGSCRSAQLVESERVEEYHKRNHSWPPLESDYKPQTEGWIGLHEQRFEQLRRMQHGGKRYNGYMSFVHTALLSPNFTEFGWALTKAPKHIVSQLRKSLHKGLADGAPIEGVIESIASPDPPLFIEQRQVNSHILKELKPIHESWVNQHQPHKVELVGNNAYGLRVYRNQSSLNMHVDKSGTHIVSSILHVDHDPASDPWPIVIEDFLGRTHEVSLETGDMLLYESSKCMHGRPRKFNGAWYSSVFIHYYPKDWPGDTVKMDAHYRIPPTWGNTLPPTDDLEELDVIETSFQEPNCQNRWCALQQSIRWTNSATPQQQHQDDSPVIPPLQLGQFVSADGIVRELPGVRDHFRD